MSAAELPGAETAVAPPRLSTRFFRSELMLIFGRRRNWFGLSVLAAVPVLVAVVLRISNPAGGAGEGDFLSSVADSGVFVALGALTLELPLFLPLAVAAISADAIAGEANLGTLRYLLAVPVHRTRLLLVKYAAVVVFTVAATLLVAVVGAAIGAALFGTGSFVTLSGTTLPLAAGLGRILLCVGYLSACLCALGAVGMFVSSLTEQPVAATIATAALAVISQILDAIPQLDRIHPYLLSDHWMAYVDLLRDPMATDGVRAGLVSALVYVLLFGSAAWARLGSRDVTC
jgi:ABC-2 type transport system permease protein